MEKRYTLEMMYNGYKNGTRDFTISKDGFIIIPLSALGSGSYYDEVAFVDSEGDINRIYRIDIPTGEDLDSVINLIRINEKRGANYESTRKIVRSFFREGNIYRYTANNSKDYGKTKGRGKREKSSADVGNSQFMQDRARNVAKNVGAEFTVKNGKINIHFEDDANYSLDVDSEGNKLTEAQAEYFKDSKANTTLQIWRVVQH